MPTLLPGDIIDFITGKKDKTIDQLNSMIDEVKDIEEAKHNLSVIQEELISYRKMSTYSNAKKPQEGLSGSAIAGLLILSAYSVMKPDEAGVWMLARLAGTMTVGGIAGVVYKSLYDENGLFGGNRCNRAHQRARLVEELEVRAYDKVDSLAKNKVGVTF